MRQLLKAVRAIVVQRVRRTCTVITGGAPFSPKAYAGTSEPSARSKTILFAPAASAIGALSIGMLENYTECIRVQIFTLGQR